MMSPLSFGAKDLGIPKTTRNTRNAWVDPLFADKNGRLWDEQLSDCQVVSFGLGGCVKWK